MDKLIPDDAMRKACAEWLAQGRPSVKFVRTGGRIFYSLADLDAANVKYSQEPK
jgi:hypothetical protein